MWWYGEKCILRRIDRRRSSRPTYPFYKLNTFRSFIRIIYCMVSRKIERRNWRIEKFLTTSKSSAVGWSGRTISCFTFSMSAGFINLLKDFFPLPSHIDGNDVVPNCLEHVMFRVTYVTR